MGGRGVAAAKRTGEGVKETIFGYQNISYFPLLEFMTANRHGLPRTIPADVRRQVRRNSKQGCVAYAGS